MAVLGITAAGLLGLHVGAVRGIAESGSMSVAMDIATQRVEQYSLEGPEFLTVAGRNCGAALESCSLARPNPTNVITNANCSGIVGTANVPNADGNDSGATVGTRFRYDTEARTLGGAQAGAVMTTVHVCWREPNGVVHRVQSRRLITPRERG